MGLITKEVEVVLNGSNQKHFESLGYEIPKIYNGHGKWVVPRNSKITVKTLDLKPKSNVDVCVVCDCCGLLLNIAYSTYNQCKRGEKYYCHKCVMSIFYSGENCYKWNNNKTEEERILGRKILKYTKFIKQVLNRDNFICQHCNKEIKNGNAEVHHLDGYDWCVERRTDETNGITLCKTCHKNFHLIYGYGNNTKAQFEEWNNCFVELKKYSGEIYEARKLYDFELNEIFDSASDYAKIYKVNISSVRRCCNHIVRTTKRKLKDGTIKIRKERVNTVKGHHLFWLDEYEKMSEEEVFQFVKNSSSKLFRKNVCITTGEIFKTLKQSSDKYNISGSMICQCCKNEIKSAGKLPDGTPLQWMYYEDFLKLPIEEQNKILARNQELLNDGSFIM